MFFYIMYRHTYSRYKVNVMAINGFKGSCMDFSIFIFINYMFPERHELVKSCLRSLQYVERL